MQAQIFILHKGRPFNVLIPPHAREIFYPAIIRMMEYFSVQGMIRTRGTPPTYHGYLYHIKIGAKPII